MERISLRSAIATAAEQHSITLIGAPFGSGKSTLLAQVRDELERPGRAADRPSVTILDDFTASGAPTPSEIEAAARCGRRWLLASDRRLDDLFAGSRIRGEVAEFGVDDLALREEELAVFLGESLAQGAPKRALRALHTATEGWMGAWNVLRELLAQGVSASDLARSFSGRDRAMAAYFDQVVMSALGPEVAAFLIDIAPLDEVTEATAEAATGGDCRELVHAAVRDCAFLLPVDRNGVVYRPHQLFKDYLAGRAKARDPARYAASALRAAEFAATRSDWLAAARLFSEAGAADRSAEILHRYADDLIVGRGEVQSFRQLIGVLPKAADAASDLTAEQALGSLIAGDYAGAAALVERAAAARSDPDEDSEAKLEAIGICIDFGLERFQQVRQSAGRWLDEHGQVDARYRTMVAAAMFWTSQEERDGPGAQRALSLARDAVSAAHSPFLAGWLAIMTAMYRYERGEIGAAALALEAAGDASTIRHTVNLVRAALALEQGRLAQARQLIQTSLRPGARHSVVETSIYGWDTAARLAWRDLGLTAALQLFEEAEAVVASRHSERAARLMRLRRATLILQSPGEAGHADLLGELKAILQEALAVRAPVAFVEEARLVLARAEILGGDAHRAISLLQPVQAAAQRSQRMARWGTTSLLYAGALARLGDPRRAMRQAWPALERFAEGGFDAAVSDEHVLLSPLLEALVSRVRNEGTPSAALRGLIEHLAERGGLRPASAYDEPLEIEEPVSLTDTERRVLGLVGLGRSNEEIASQLSIRLSTVKWHLSNTFAKLAVRSRTAALIQARRHGVDV